MTQRKRWVLVAALFLGLGVGLTSCDSGTRGGSGSQILNLVNSAAPLPTDNTVYATAQMHTPGYGHTANRVEDSTVVVIGGSDERHFTSMGRVEVYDQSVREDPQPESITGVWFGLDFTGEPIEMTHSRVFHTTTRLPDGNLLVIGGTSDILVGDTVAQAEIYDIQSRTFRSVHLEVNGPMLQPRFNHTATPLASGKILVAGGQASADETIIDPTFPPGHPQHMVDIVTFPSTEELEIFDPATRTFEPAVDFAGNPLELQTSRGRSEHASISIGGFDGSLETSDDLYVFGAGIRTLSPLFAPQLKFPQRSDVFYVTQLEYYDRGAGAISVVNGVDTLRRANGVRVMNCGEHTEVTPMGYEGTTNVILITHGNDDSHDQIGNPGWTQPQSELIAASFTGFGPSNGVSFWSATAEFGAPLGSNPVNVPQLCTGFEYRQAMANAQMLCANVTRGDYVGTFLGRVETPLETVVYSRLFNGEFFKGSWGITGGGGSTHRVNISTPDVEHFTWCVGGDQMGMEYFDPYYNVTTPMAAIPETANPARIMGTWLAADNIVAEDNEGFGLFDSLVAPLSARLRGATCYHTMTKLPGEDGIIDTKDDRILVAGGGQTWLQTGGEPTGVSAHIFVPAGAHN